LFLDQDGAKAAALDYGTRGFGDRRVVEQGEVNQDLLPLMSRKRSGTVAGGHVASLIG
jgi:hypothetical protein